MIDNLKPREQKDPVIRMSKLGTPDRKLWFDHNSDTPDEETNNHLKFLYGHIIEQLVLFLLKEAGHSVTEEQEEVTISGIKGHKDAKVDGVCVDVKSASSFAFRKFANGTLFQDDPFGYVAQLSAYSHPEKAAFIAVNKETGQIAILDLEPIDMIEPEARIARCKEVIQLPEPPKEKCYKPEVELNGNKKLNKNCTYCKHRFKCWEKLRVFDYASGPVYFTEVHKEPRVPEIPLNRD